MSSPVRKAREALGARLVEIRKDANLTGRALAQACGWHYTKVSKIEHGTQSPTDDELRQWCRACRAEDQVLDLIATSRAIESMYVEWRRQFRAGLKSQQAAAIPLYEQTKQFRVYENQVIPGLLHTAEYAAALFAFWSDFLALPSNIDEAVATRMERQRVLYTGKRRFAFVLEEQTLRTHVGDRDVMAGQLDRLLALMSLSRVSIGIIPAMAPRQCYTQGAFWIFDENRVQVEGVSAGVEITQPREIALYTKAFELLQASAVYGAPARALITAVLDETSSSRV